MVVQPLEQHRERPAEVRDDVGDVREAVRDPLRDQVQRDHRILHRGADRRAETVVDDRGRTNAVAARMVEDDPAATVHLLVDRQELVLCDRAIEDGDVQVDADHPEFVHPALEFPQ